MRKSLVFLLWMVTSIIAFAQLPSGTINGRVIDPQGNIIVNALVTFTNNDKSLSREIITNADGLYAIPALPAGAYDLHVESPGLAVSEAHKLTLDVGTIITANISLHVASTNDIVTVNGLNQTVDLTQSMIQGQIGSHTIESIPLNGRNFLELAYLVPGNRPAPAFDPTKTNTFEVSSAGSFGRGGNITVDGGDNNDEVVGGTLSTGTRDFVTDEILNTAAPAPLRAYLWSTRFDQQLGSKNSLMGRYSFDHSTDTAEATPSQTTPAYSAAERQNTLNRFNSVEAALTTLLSTTRVNGFSFHFDQFFNNIPPYPEDAPTTDPALNLTNELIFPGIADGANSNLPQSTSLNRYQFRDAYSWTLGKHTLRLGGEFRHYTAHGLINVFGTGTVILTANFGFADLNGDGTINDLDIPVAVGIHSTAPVVPVPIPTVFNNYVGAYAQDDWRINPRLTLNLGLRWEYDSNLTGNSSAHDPCSDLISEPTKPCTWMANVIDLEKSPDTRDFGPRVGFAWDPFGQGKTVLRGGYGIYHDRIILEAGAEELVQNDRALTVTQYAGSSCTSPFVPGPPSLNACFAPGGAFATGSPTLTSAFPQLPPLAAFSAPEAQGRSSLLPALPSRNPTDWSLT